MQDSIQTEPETRLMVCTRTSFQPAPTKGVRWLAPRADFYRFEQTARTRGVVPPDYETWLRWHEQGCSFCAIAPAGTIVAYGLVVRHTEVEWEISGIRTLDAHQKQGHGTSIARFLTHYVLAERERVVCHVPIENEVMQRLLNKIGYQSSPNGK